MNADQPFGVFSAKLFRDSRTHVAGVDQEALVAELSQSGEQLGDAGRVHAGRSRAVGEAVAGQRRGDHMESSGGQARDDLQILEDRARPAVSQDQRHRVPDV